MFISIIIPTCNRANTLKITLNSILQQTNLQDFEVIIVDNGSIDETKKICAEFVQVTVPQYRYYYDAEPGLLTGRHLGASLAHGEILCFLDDDVELDPFWITGVKNAFNNPEVQLATGPCLPKYEADPPAWLKYFWRNVRGQGISCSWLSLLNLGNKKKIIDPNYVWGLNFCIRKAALKSLEGFHPDNIPSHYQMFQGDGETGLTMKARTLGYKAIYHPQIKVQHLISAERLTVEYLEKRAFYQGVCDSFTLLRQKHINDQERYKFNSVAVIKKLLLLVKKSVSLVNRSFTPKAIRDLMNELEEKQKDGFNFHQTAFKNNPKVREWVLRQNYWDYKLPH